MNGKSAKQQRPSFVGCRLPVSKRAGHHPSHTNMRASTTTHGSFLPMVISNGTNAHPAVISVRNHSGRITGVTDSVSPTSLVWRVVATIMAMSVSGHRPGSDTNRFLGGIHLGYEHNYVLRGGWRLFCQVKTDLMIKGEDLFRTGIVLGIKLPLN